MFHEPWVIDMKKYLTILSILLTVLSFLVCCVKTETGSIAITIYDMSNDSLLSDVSVKLGSEYELWDVTNDQGLIIFEEMDVGEYTLRAYTSMYQDEATEIEVTEEDQAIDVFLTPVQNGHDVTAPRIVGKDVYGEDLYILFSESMNKSSFTNAIENEAWIPDDKKCDVVPNSKYSLKWIRSSRLKINHANDADCTNDRVDTTWILKSIKINTSPTDRAGNHLQQGYSYTR